MYHWTTTDIESTLSAYSHESQFTFHGYALEGRTAVGEPLDESLIDKPAHVSLSLPDTSLERETSLLMFYLDHAFRLQFPFYEPPLSAGGRTWLLSLLTSAKPAYYATLSLAARYSKRLLPSDEALGAHVRWWEEEMKHRPVATEELHASVVALTPSGDSYNIRATVNALACMMQMLCLDSLQNGVEHWRSYLYMASPLLTTLAELMETQPAPTTQANMDSWTVQPIYASNSEHPLSYESSAALKFVVTVFVWIDTLARVSTGSSPIFYGYRHLVNTNTSIIQLEQLMGCKNWVMSHIIEIAALEQWKKDAQSENRLSLRELVAKATEIEARLTETAAASLGSTESVAMRINALDANRKTNRVVCITHLFALSALTYLHIVVSGFNPTLDEVRHNVCNTLASLEALPNPLLLLHLAWPFCVTGCMAEPHQEDAFRKLLARAEASGDNDQALVRCRAALEVMEEIWKKRNNRLTLPDSWAAAMQLQGTPVLLI